MIHFKNSPFFRYLAPDILRAIAETATELVLPDKKVLIQEGDISPKAYLLLEGEVNVSHYGENAEELVRSLKPGSVFGRGPLNQEPEQATFTTTGPARFWIWPRDIIEKQFQKFSLLQKQFLTRISLTKRLWEILELLKRSSLFRGMSPTLLRRMLEGATLSFFPSGTLIFAEGSLGESFYLVVNGEIAISRTEKTLSYLYPGDSFGEIALLKKVPRNASATATQDSTLLIFDQQDFQTLSEQSSIFRHAIHALMEERLGIHENLKKTAELILIINHTPHAALADWLCESLNAQFFEKACVVTDATEALQKRISGEFHYVFVVPPRDQERFLLETLQKHLFTLLYVSSDQQTLPYPVSQTLNTLHAVVTQGHASSSIARRGAVRLHWPQGFTESSWPQLPNPVRTSIDRLTRALSHRLVGLALGGGGAWGLGHIALLRGLVSARIPIDIISGTSFGSIIGACFASTQQRGLDQLLEKRRRMHWVSKCVYWTTWPMAKAVQDILHHHELQDLEIPFLPVAVNIMTGEERTFRQGSIAKSLQASCAFPALIAPAILGGQRYVDGAVLNNVPASVVAEEGADFIIASNVIPAPQKIATHLKDHFLAQLQSALWPRSRIKDLVRSFYILMNQAGEQQASCADLVFKPDLSLFSSSEFSKALEIVKKAEETLDPFLITLQERYRTFCVRR